MWRAFGHSVAKCWVLLAQIWPYSTAGSKEANVPLVCHTIESVGNFYFQTLDANNPWDWGGGGGGIHSVTNFNRLGNLVSFSVCLQKTNSKLYLLISKEVGWPASIAC